MAEIFRFSSNKAFPIVLVLLMLAITIIGCTPSGYTGTPVKVLVVMVKLDKQPPCPTPADCEPNIGPAVQAKITNPRNNAADTMQLVEKAVNKYYQNATYGQMYFDFKLLENPNSTDGWWDAPHTIAEYNKAKATFQQDSVSIAYTVLGDEIDNYDRILYIQNVKERGGQTCCLHTPTPFYAEPATYYKINLNNSPTVSNGFSDKIIAQVNEGTSDQELITVTAHELGHTVGAPDEYYGYFVGMGPWDLMDNDWEWTHFGAWTKLDRDWIDWTTNTTRMPCVTGSCTITTALDPQEIKGNNALLVPVNNASEFMGIMAECRKKINGDENIPDEGVLITLSNPYLNIVFAGTASEVSSYKTNPYSILGPGDVYYNIPAAVRITNMSQPGDSKCTVKAERMLPEGPDLYIRQGDIIQGQVFDKYKSPDIWNDTAINGNFTYPDYETVETVETDSGTSTIPAGYGDPISTTADNTIIYRVFNGGNLLVNQFKVNVYVRQPLSVSVQSASCGASDEATAIKYANLPKLIDTETFYHLKPGRSVIGQAKLVTDKATPLEIEVEIIPVDGELDETNNIAYETYTHFYGQADASISNAVNGTGMSAGVSTLCKTGIPFIAQEIAKPDGSKCDWDLAIEPASGIMLPGETVDFTIKGGPAAGSNAGDSCNSTFGVFMPVTDVFTPVNAFDFTARVVDPSSITCVTPPGAISTGTPVIVTGELKPSKTDTIGLLYTDPTGLSEMKNQQTGANGEYVDQFVPGIPGTWSVQALWVGDSKHAQTESTVCTFNVEKQIVKQPPVFRAAKPANCRAGTSIFYRTLGLTTAGIDYGVLAVNDFGGWYLVQFNSAIQCWVKADTGKATGDLTGVEVLHIDLITPTPVKPTFTPTPVLGSFCSQFTDVMNCQELHITQCKWIHPSGPCVDL
jgi:M6 family metalloprotease-like protein